MFLASSCQHSDSRYFDFLFLGPVKKITPISAGEPARISSSQRQLQVWLYVTYKEHCKLALSTLCRPINLMFCSKICDFMS